MKTTIQTIRDSYRIQNILTASPAVHAVKPLRTALDDEPQLPDVAGHTPGIWGVPDKRDHIVTVINEQGFEVTIAKCGESYVLSEAEMKANARLIARAPALLASHARLVAALEQALTRMQIAHRNGPFKFAMEINNARAALEAAKGQS